MCIEISYTERKENVKNKKLRIAVLGHKRIPSREGGIEIVVEELSVRMAKMGHQVTVYNRSGHHVSGKEFDAHKLKEYKGTRMKYVPTIDKKGLAAMSASFFAAVAAAFGKYDVVHFHAEGPCAMLWLPKLFGKRCIATVHGLDHQRAKWGKLASTYIMLGEKCAIKCADEIIVLSEGVQNYFKETYGRDTKFIPNGVNRPVIRKAELIDKKFGLKKDDYILFLGRLVPEKGITYLIEGFKNVKTDKKLVIAGGSSDTDEFANQLKEMAKDDDRIIFTGFVQGQLLDELYSNASLREKWKKYMYLFIAICIGSGAVLYLENRAGLEIFDRFSKLSTDGGSGRDIIWAITLQAFKMSNIREKILGHGFQSVYYRLKPGGFSRFSHNSYIEYLYDYGIIGLSLLVLFVLSLIIIEIKFIREKNKYAPVMGMLLIITIFLSAFSYFFEESNIIQPTAVAYGIILGQAHKERKDCTILMN